MIGMVLVSHSETLAKGVLELMQQMVQNKVPIALAAGTDNPDEPIGTDPMKVMTAIESVYGEDGVLILMDLGSALMSAEAAIEFLEPEQQEKIYLCEVPLVEGGLAAAVAAAGGASMEFIISEARDALTDKTAQLEPVLRIPPSLRATTPSTGTSSESTSTLAQNSSVDAQISLTLPNQQGLHARPAARLVSLLAPFNAEVRIRFGTRVINARSLNKIVTLGSRQGDEIIVEASGPDADSALAAISKLAAENFGDKDGAGVSLTPISTSSLDRRTASRTNASAASPQSAGAKQEDRQGDEQSNRTHAFGIPTSEGVSIGPVVLLDKQTPTFVEQLAPDTEAEHLRLRQTLAIVKEELMLVQRQTERLAGADEAAIFEAHRLMLEDPELLEQVDALFAELGLNAEAIWQRAIDATIQTYLALDNEYLRDRAADLEDVSRRVLRHLCGQDADELTFDQPSIVVAIDLHPSDTAQLPAGQVLGLILERGGTTSHSAILARALGIPAVVGVGPAVQTLSEGQVVGLDGSSGHIWLTPSEDQVAELGHQRQAWLDNRQRLLDQSKEPTVTRDGKRIEVAANIGNVADAERAAQMGAEGVGLFRTEFLFMDRNEAPSEDEQVAAYRGTADALQGAPVIIRTLDIGGDKPIAYLNQLPEENPFLGWRGIRFCLDNPALFKTQLRALLQAGATQPIQMMLPMVSTVDEVRQAKMLIAAAQEELKAEAKAFDASPTIGIMIETPAAVLNAHQLAAEVDFFSIGTNDLTQYVMAADRGNAQVAGLINPFQPAVLHAIRSVIRAAHEADIWVGMCGEMAGNPLAAVLLVGLQMDELSMSSTAIPQIKALIRNLSTDKACQVASHALTLESAEAVQDYLAEAANL